MFLLSLMLLTADVDAKPKIELQQRNSNTAFHDKGIPVYFGPNALFANQNNLAVNNQVANKLHYNCDHAFAPIIEKRSWGHQWISSFKENSFTVDFLLFPDNIRQAFISALVSVNQNELKVQHLSVSPIHVDKVLVMITNPLTKMVVAISQNEAIGNHNPAYPIRLTFITTPENMAIIKNISDVEFSIYFEAQAKDVKSAVKFTMNSLKIHEKAENMLSSDQKMAIGANYTKEPLLQKDVIDIISQINQDSSSFAFADSDKMANYWHADERVFNLQESMNLQNFSKVFGKEAAEKLREHTERDIFQVVDQIAKEQGKENEVQKEKSTSFGSWISGGYVFIFGGSDIKHETSNKIIDRTYEKTGVMFEKKGNYFVPMKVDIYQLAKVNSNLKENKSSQANVVSREITGWFSHSHFDPKVFNSNSVAETAEKLVKNETYRQSLLNRLDYIQNNNSEILKKLAESSENVKVIKKSILGTTEKIRPNFDNFKYFFSQYHRIMGMQEMVYHAWAVWKQQNPEVVWENGNSAWLATQHDGGSAGYTRRNFWNDCNRRSDQCIALMTQLTNEIYSLLTDLDKNNQNILTHQGDLNINNEEVEEIITKLRAI